MIKSANFLTELTLTYWLSIENVWDMLDRRVRPRITADCTLQDFRRYLTEEWQRIPQRAIDKVVHSMRGRVNEVLWNEGGHTHYRALLLIFLCCH